MSSKRGRRQASSVLSSAGGTVGGVGAVAAKAARPSSGASDALMASLTTTLVDAMSSPGGDADYASAAATGDVKKTRRPRDMEEELIEAQGSFRALFVFRPTFPPPLHLFAILSEPQPS